MVQEDFLVFLDLCNVLPPTYDRLAVCTMHDSLKTMTVLDLGHKIVRSQPFSVRCCSVPKGGLLSQVEPAKTPLLVLVPFYTNRHIKT